MLLTLASIGSILAVDATFNAPDASAANTPLCPVYNGTCVKLVGSFYVVEDSWSKRASLWDGWYKRCYERRTYTFYLQDHRYRQGQDLGKVGPVYISSQWKGTLTKRVPC